MRGILALLLLTATARAQVRCPGDRDVALVADATAAYVSVNGALRAVELPAGTVRWRRSDGPVRPVAALPRGRLLVERSGTPLVLDAATGQDTGEPPPAPAAAGAPDPTQVVLRGRLYRLGGDCQRGELAVFDGIRGSALGAPLTTGGRLVAVVVAGPMIVAARQDGALLVVPPRGTPRPRVVGWRQVRP